MIDLRPGRPQLVAFLTWTCIFLVSMSCTTTTKAPRELSFHRLWTRDLVHTGYLGPRRTNLMPPYLTEKTVYQGNGVDGFSAFDRKSGRIRWKLPIRHGVSSDAVIVNNKLFFGASDGQFYCVDPETGTPFWAVPIRSEALSSPLVNEKRVYLLAGNNTLIALNSENGKQVWAYNRPETTALSVRAGPRPALHGDVLYVGFSDGALTAINATDGSLMWERQLNTNSRFRDVDASAVIDGELLFVSTFEGALFALSRKDGQIVWRHDEGGINPVTIDRDIVYYSTSNGKVLSLEKKTGKVLNSYSVPGGIATQPQLYRGLLIVGESAGALRIFNLQTGETVSTFDPGRGILARPTIDPNTGEIFIVSNQSNLYALQMRWDRKSSLQTWQRVDEP